MPARPHTSVLLSLSTLPKVNEILKKPGQMLLFGGKLCGITGVVTDCERMILQ